MSRVPPTPYLWHNAVHQHWGDAKLVFFFLSYEPTYKRERATKQLIEFLQSHDIRSYQMYELSAPYDILIRAWVPSRTARSTLREELEKNKVSGDVFEVVDTVHHWAWATGADATIGSMHHPHADELEAGRPVRERAQINALQRERPSPETAFSSECLRDYKSARLLVQPKYRPGIRFAVLVKVRRNTNRTELQQRLCELLYDAKRTIKSPSLYRLDDQYQFLILGRVAEREGAFHSISTKLVSKINDYAASATARTYTSYVAIPGFLAFEDELPVVVHHDDEEEPSAAELLQQAESEDFEVKGSVFTDLDPWIRGKGDLVTSKKPLRDSKSKAVDHLLRAIASLLNTRGGNIVVGALEKSKYSECARFHELPVVGSRGEYGCCGIELEYRHRGDWDRVERDLTDLIAHRFDPSPVPYWVKIERDEVCGQDVCVIRVKHSDESYWVKVLRRGGGLEPRFIGRVGARAQDMTDGRRMHEHQRKFPRSKR